MLIYYVDSVVKNIIDNNDISQLVLNPHVSEFNEADQTLTVNVRRLLTVLLCCRVSFTTQKILIPMIAVCYFLNIIYLALFIYPEAFGKVFSTR